jgi:uncharacterized membrane protein
MVRYPVLLLKLVHLLSLSALVLVRPPYFVYFALTIISIFLASVSEALPLDFSDEKTLADSSQKKRPRMTPHMSTTNNNVRLLISIILFISCLFYIPAFDPNA